MRFLFGIFGDGCREPGYTLIEVMLVVITVGVLAAVSLPRFGGGTVLYKHKVDAAINRLVSDLRYTRQLAITTSSNHQLIIDVPLKSYAIYKEPVNPSNQIDETRYMDNLIDLAGDTIFIFEPKGNASLISGTSCTLSEGGYSHAINIVRATGRIKW